MREVSVRLRFDSPCLGNTPAKVDGARYFALPRNLDQQVVFMPSWWSSTLRRAALILNRNQRLAAEVRFALPVAGRPRPVPQQLHKHYHGASYSRHEQFGEGDTIEVQCVVPTGLSDEELRELLETAGKYCGISPSKSNQTGHYRVESIGPVRPAGGHEEERDGTIMKSMRPAST